VPVADLLQRHPGAWVRATRPAFLAGVRDGTLPEAAFNVWLAQDYLFVADLLRFQARLLSRAPRSAQAELASGLMALVDELAWFEERADARGLDLAVGPLPATAAYTDLLRRLNSFPFAVALAALWVLERVYLDAWSYAAPGAPAYRDFVAHWTTPPFAAYVAALESLADNAIQTAGSASTMDHDQITLEAVFGTVLDAESGFWNMTWPGRTP
jgi:formylaminopyrimidine deformylase / aminopyrimidine aminohydrolase